MALSFANATDIIDAGSPAEYDNLDVFTYIAWIYPTNPLTSGGIVAKGTSGGNARRSFEIRTSVVAGGLYLTVDRATTDTQYEANVLVDSAWQCVAVTYDVAATPTTHLYYGTLTAAMSEPTYTTNQDGSGATGDNSALPVYIGAYGGGTSGGAGKRIGPVAIFNRVLSLGEVRSWQFAPRKLDGCVGFYRLGDNGTGTQVDLSGNFNSATVTGPTVVANPPLPPLIGGRVRQVPRPAVGGGGGSAAARKRFYYTQMG